MPPGKLYEKAKTLENPVILDWDVSHPLMQYVRDLSNVVIAKANGVDLPPGASVLIESNLGPLAFVAPREGYADAVVTFALLDGEIVQHDLVQEYQFPFVSLQQLDRAGQRARVGRGRDPFAGGERRPAARTRRNSWRSLGPDGRKVETVAQIAAGDVCFLESG